LLAVSQTERVDDLISVSRAAKVSPLVVDVEAYSIERAFNVIFPESDEQRIALVDIGAMSTTLYVFENGQLIYIRDQFFGSNQLTEEIQRRYSLSSVEAEEAKQSVKLPQGYFKNVLEPFKEVLVQQIERSLQFFYSSNANAQIDRCFLCGGGANLENLAQETQNQINVTTERLDPIANIDISSKAEKQGFEDCAKQMMTAIGLAMRSY
ncbi:MAG: type IV pilus assembly protein PilM, partial [Pseudomonadota bacterium]|nr:type IV pilus assembly protein PilM [Pseudomonadota bacterium]